MTVDEQKSWYLIYTKPKQEQVALLNLERQGFESYLPVMQVSRRRQGKHQWLIEPMFPRYLFIHLSSEFENWSPIRSTRGVISMVRFGGMPAQVPLSLILSLRAHEGEALAVAASDDAVPRFKEGDAVRIVEGAFAGYEGIFSEESGAKRATVLLSIADRFTRVQLSVDDVDGVK